MACLVEGTRLYQDENYGAGIVDTDRDVDADYKGHAKGSRLGKGVYIWSFVLILSVLL